MSRPISTLLVALIGGALTLAFATPATATHPEVNAWLERVLQAANDVQRAKEAYESAADPGERERYRRHYEDLRERHEGSKANLDRARIYAIADEADVSPRRVRRMRADGMGWGKIAKELGIHPSVVGKGHGEGKAKKRKRNHDWDDDCERRCKIRHRHNGQHENDDNDHKHRHHAGAKDHGKVYRGKEARKD